MQATNELIVPLLLCLMLILSNYVYFVVWLHVKMRSGTEPRPFHFYITDYWAVMLSLAPSLAYSVITIRSAMTDVELRCLQSASLIFCQALGIIAGLIVSRPRHSEAEPRRLDRFVCVIGGSLLGAFFSFIAYGIAETVQCGCCVLLFAEIVALPWFADIFRKRPADAESGPAQRPDGEDRK